MLRRSIRSFSKLLPSIYETTHSIPAFSKDSVRSFTKDLNQGFVSNGLQDDTLLDPMRICEMAQAAEHASILQEANEHWIWISVVQQSLEWVHVTTGCPWWLSIALITLGFRTMIFPVTLIQIRNSIKLSNAMPETERAKITFEQYVAQGMDAKQARNWYTTEITKIWKKYDCNPMKSMTPLFANGFVFISFFIALRGLSEIKVPSMCYEGMLWFTDLTISDPYYVLPVLNSAIFLLTIELGAADGMQGQPPEMMKRMKFFMRILSVIFIPVTANFPASLFCYWVTSSCFSLLQSTLIKQKGIRSFLNLPPSVKRDLDLSNNPIFRKPAKQILVDGNVIAPKVSIVDPNETMKDKVTTMLKGEASPVLYATNQKRKKSHDKKRQVKHT